MTKPSVSVDGVSKKFGLTLKSALKYGIVDSLRRAVGRDKADVLREGEFWALSDVSFDLNPGDALGIMGVNGSGKTTLLRILNGTYSPDKGKVTMRGRLGALIAAGAGFSPMLTGRENVFISGALLGMKTKEIRRRFDEIVAFSELGEFIDMPVRNYSSGMSVRLGFAVPVLGTPDVLLVDEVLAVGDISFQKKCYERIHALKEEGTTILLVSHSPGAVWAVCNKGLVLHHGSTGGIADVEQACKMYDDYNLRSRAAIESSLGGKDLSASYDSSRCGTGDAYITQFEVFDENMCPVEAIEYGRPFTLRCHILFDKEIDDGIVRISIDSEVHKCVAIIDNYESSMQLFRFKKGQCSLDISIDEPNLRPGVYSFTVAILSKGFGVHFFLEHNIASLAITNPVNRFFYADFRAVMHLDSRYSVDWR